MSKKYNFHQLDNDSKFVADLLFPNPMSNIANDFGNFWKLSKSEDELNAELIGNDILRGHSDYLRNIKDQLRREFIFLSVFNRDGKDHEELWRTMEIETHMDYQRCMLHPRTFNEYKSMVDNLQEYNHPDIDIDDLTNVNLNEVINKIDKIIKDFNHGKLYLLSDDVFKRLTGIEMFQIFRALNENHEECNLWDVCKDPSRETQIRALEMIFHADVYERDRRLNITREFRPHLWLLYQVFEDPKIKDKDSYREIEHIDKRTDPEVIKMLLTNNNWQNYIFAHDEFFGLYVREFLSKYPFTSDLIQYLLEESKLVDYIQPFYSINFSIGNNII